MERPDSRMLLSKSSYILSRGDPLGAGYNVYLMMSLLQLWTSSDYLANYVISNKYRTFTKRQIGANPAADPHAR